MGILQDAFESFYAEYQPFAVRFFARKMPADDVENCAEDVFVRLWEYFLDAASVVDQTLVLARTGAVTLNRLAQERDEAPDKTLTKACRCLKSGWLALRLNDDSKLPSAPAPFNALAVRLLQALHQAGTTLSLEALSEAAGGTDEEILAALEPALLAETLLIDIGDPISTQPLKYLFWSTCRNRLVDYYRERDRKAAQPLPDDGDGSAEQSDRPSVQVPDLRPAIVEHVEHRMWIDGLRPRLEACLKQLSDRQRQCAILHHYYGYSTKFVAEILRIGDETVKDTLKEALKRMRTNCHQVADYLFPVLWTRPELTTLWHTCPAATHMILATIAERPQGYRADRLADKLALSEAVIDYQLVTLGHLIEKYPDKPHLVRKDSVPAQYEMAPYVGMMVRLLHGSQSKNKAAMPEHTGPKE